MAGKKRGNDQLIQGAVEEGIEAIIEAHPRFKGYEQYISDHIDKRKLRAGIQHINSYIAKEGKNLSDEERVQIFYKNLASYVSSGEIFDDKAKRVILRKSLEENTRKSGWGRRQLDGEKYIDKVGAAFKDLYGLMKTGDYGRRMPEFAEAVTIVNDLGFLDSALDILSSYDLIDDRSYNDIKQNIEQKARDKTKKIGETYEKYLNPENVSASILIGVGAGLLIASGSGITGNVIGLGSNINLTGISGIGLLMLGAILLGRRKW